MLFIPCIELSCLSEERTFKLLDALSWQFHFTSYGRDFKLSRAVVLLALTYFWFHKTPSYLEHLWDRKAMSELLEFIRSHEEAFRR